MPTINKPCHAKVFLEHFSDFGWSTTKLVIVKTYMHSIILTSAAFARNDLCQIAAHRCHINYIHMECLDVQVINRQLTEDGACISPQLDCFNLSGPEKEEANETGEG